MSKKPSLYLFAGEDVTPVTLLIPPAGKNVLSVPILFLRKS